MDSLFILSVLAMNLALHVDHMQTLEIARNPELYHEHNPILGSHPREASVNRYFIATHIWTTGLAFLLPREYGIPFCGTVFLIEAGMVVNNNSIGLRIRF